MKNTGGPAFGSFKRIGEICLMEGGVTVRDWFAGQALHAVIDAYIVGNGPTVGTDHLPKNCAAHAYRIADAMLAEREKE